MYAILFKINSGEDSGKHFFRHFGQQSGEFPKNGNSPGFDNKQLSYRIKIRPDYGLRFKKMKGEKIGQQSLLVNSLRGMAI